jgi:hypothetical protein
MDNNTIYVVDVFWDDDDYRHQTLAYCRSDLDAQAFLRGWLKEVSPEGKMLLDEGRETHATQLHFEVFYLYDEKRRFAGDIYINPRTIFTP